MKYNDIIFNKFSELVSQGVLKPHKYKSKDVIFKEGDKSRYLSYILEGEVEIATLSYQGSVEVISILKEKETFGQFILFQEKGLYLGDVIAKKPSLVLHITKNQLLDILSSDKTFLEAYISFISNESFQIKQQVKLLSHKNALDRVLFYLESHQVSNICQIESVASLAKLVNLPRETVSRILSKLQQDKYLIKNGNQIKLIK